MSQLELLVYIVIGVSFFGIIGYMFRSKGALVILLPILVIINIVYFLFPEIL